MIKKGILEEIFRKGVSRGLHPSRLNSFNQPFRIDVWVTRRISVFSIRTGSTTIKYLQEKLRYT
ncbi:MAG: hypothetical protein CVV33_04390 [Methanomicrobiales archaeon HGW-Methanomicrobiales-4]|nr:MAG: hypothetical protein CVV33_04390 [Methanomicrobiales archaeon HGW-Methanomicrobiales-4]